MSDANEIARVVAKEYAEQTNGRIETYFKHTSEAINRMSDSVATMARSVQDSNELLARYEERQSASNDRMERLEEGLREQGIIQRKFEDETEQAMRSITDEVKDNTHVRKMAVWLSMTVITAMVGGGLLFGSVTGTIKTSKGHVHENVKTVQTNSS